MTNNVKPVGIILIIIYSALNGVMSFFGGLIFMLMSAIPDISMWIHILSILFMLFGVLLFASIYGLWSFQPWGWKLTFWLYFISIPLSIISIFPIWPDTEMSLGNTIIQLFVIGVDVISILYLKKDEIKELYEIYDFNL